MELYFAPLEGLTDSIYRRLHHEYFGGIDRYYMPFLSPTIHRTLTHKEDRELPVADSVPFTAVPQLLGKNVEDMLWAIEVCRDQGYDEVNINLGCPSGTVVSKGKGSGMLRDLEHLDRFLEEIFEKCPLQISIKTRIGMYDPEEFDKLLEIYNRYPVYELTVHARTREEYYRGQVHWETFEKAVRESKCPVCYNGDLFSRTTLNL